MQILITDSRLARNRVVQLSPWQLVGAAVGLVLTVILVSGLTYHFVFLKAAREGWPVVSQIVRFVVRDEFEQRDRFMRENLDAMAQKVGEMQAKLVRLQTMSERVSDLAGVKPEELKPLERASSGGGRGGPYVPLARPSLEELHDRVEALDRAADQSTDVFTLVESRLFEARLAKLLVPSSAPVDGPVGSGFGFRTDPFTGRAALHTGLDFPADVGTPIVAAAGGVVVSTEDHPAYGHMVEIDHGRGLRTRYAHASKIVVRDGDLVRKGQKVAEVGSSGRSTGPHLHFEVLVDGVPQNPQRFLARSGTEPVRAAAQRRVSGDSRVIN
jgi:murein DD-endopeptidase MepM/ murein hydrolase activator NlpD